MNTLLRAGTIRSIKEVWWDVRPHPDFGTIEIRILDGVPTLHEAGMAGALSQSPVHLFGTQLDRGYRLPSQLQPVAERLGCAEEVDVLGEVLERGASYERQRAVVATGGGLTDVVDALVTELAEDRFVRPGEDRYAGP